MKKLNETTHYEKGVQEPWFSLIKKGIKSVEGRLNKGDFSRMKIGDIVTWTNSIKKIKSGKTKIINRKVKTKIIGIGNYSNFYQMIKVERLKKYFTNT